MSVQILTPGIKPTQWNVHRAGVAQEWRHLWDDLVMGFYMPVAGGNPTDIVRGFQNTLSLGTEDYIRTSRGVALRTTVDGGGTTTIVPTNLQGRGWPITMAWYGYSTGAEPDASAAIFTIYHNNTPAAPWVVASIGFPSTTPRFLMIMGNDGVDLVQSASTIVPHTDILKPTLFHAVFASAASWRLYQDGVLVHSVDPPGSSDPDWGTNPVIGFGQDTQRASTNSNTIHLAGFVWYKELSVAAIQQHALDPFGFVRPDFSTIGKAPAVAGLSIPIAAYHHNHHIRVA